jgi:hypothetical protein
VINHCFERRKAVFTRFAYFCGIAKNMLDARNASNYVFFMRRAQRAAEKSETKDDRERNSSLVGLLAQRENGEFRGDPHRQ